MTFGQLCIGKHWCRDILEHMKRYRNNNICKLKSNNIEVGTGKQRRGRELQIVTGRTLDSDNVRVTVCIP